MSTLQRQIVSGVLLGGRAPGSLRRGSVSTLLAFCLCLGGSHGALASGKLDDARSKYYGQAQAQYVDMVNHLEAKNFEAAMRSAEALKAQLTAVDSDFLYVDEAVKALDPDIQRSWSEFYGTGSAWRYLSLYSGRILGEIGKRDHTEAMNSIKANYEKCGNDLNKVTDMFKEYGRRMNEKYKKLGVVSDSWK